MSNETVHVVTDLPAKSSHPKVRKFAVVAVISIAVATAAYGVLKSQKAAQPTEEPETAETTSEN